MKIKQSNKRRGGGRESRKVGVGRRAEGDRKWDMGWAGRLLKLLKYY
jgi:hypothetical protein